MKRAVFFIAFVMLLTANVVKAEDVVDLHKVERGKAIAEELSDLRSNLAKTYIKPKVKISEELSNKICVAVSERAKTLAKDEGYLIKFMATKFRNPENKADDVNEKYLLVFFEKTPELKDNYWWTYIDEKEYRVYVKPIYAEKPCLVCHGEVKKMPEFIRKRYPKDVSFGFQEGKLMGAIEVFIRSNR